MKFELPELPYALDALEPVISKQTLHHHFEKHHAGYLKKLDVALEGGDRDKPLEDIILDSYKQENPAVFNPAAQVWNHSFYWNSMTPEPVALDDQRLIELIDSSFGGADVLLEKFKEAATGQFGSGWAWLLYDPKRDALQITSTSDAHNPIPTEQKPLLTLDVWEHAYYLDYQQDRGKYVDGVLDKLINWQFVAANLGS